MFRSIIGVLQFLTVTSSQIEPKVVYGDKTNISHHPYSAFIMISENDSAFICGASIINQKILLTAAHCFDDLTRKSKGTANIGHTDKRRGYIIYISTVKVHPEYNSRKITNDIALAGLERELNFSDVVKRVALAYNRPPKGSVALLAGWGLVSEEPYKSTNVLYETEQKVWARTDCVKLMKKIPDGTFCGGINSQGGYPSLGDSGSPLVVNKYLQIGLVSFKKIHISTSVIIYTDVAYFYNWIADNAGSVFCS